MLEYPRPRIGLAVMYHPARTSQAKALAEQCSPLGPRLVADPDPHGLSSPLRTAKLAWASYDPSATHHLVLQDDVTLTKDFVAHLTTVVAQLPSHGIVLYVNQGSLRNSYLARRAAAAGMRWAEVSKSEYVPTLGFLLPTAHAQRLAAHLLTFPDEYRDDDEAVTIYCKSNNVSVVAVVPNLIEHGDLPSIAGNQNHGNRHSVAFASDVRLPPGYWIGAQEEGAEVALGVPPGIPPFALEFYDSRCLIRFVRPDTDEPVDQVYGWYWHDWCSLLGIDSEHVLATWRNYVTGVGSDVIFGGGMPVAVFLELWASGYILGFDVASTAVGRAKTAGGTQTPALRAAITSWLACGLAPAHREHLSEPLAELLVDCCHEGFSAGKRHVTG